ncbi:MAG: DUF4143 domain-containing protein [Endomicrobium sp.]|nr:DUF4143 domain-containing protein [Endomicrobium sp.]
MTNYSQINVSNQYTIYKFILGFLETSKYQVIRLRDDVSGIWENFCIVERMKKNQLEGRRCCTYFWRNYEGKEIDFIEERNGELQAYEFKYNPRKNAKLPKDFKEA